MDLFQNPFFILGVGPRSTRSEIMDAAEAAGLSGDPDAVADAASALASPRKRLNAEVFFLPGMRKDAADRLLAAFKGPVRMMQPCRQMSDCAAVNLTAAALARLTADGASRVAYGISLLSRAFELVKAPELMGLINGDRKVAGLPAVPSVADVEEELDKLRLHCRTVVRGALDKLVSRELVKAAAEAARTETDDGKRPPPVLVRDMMEIYDLESRPFFEKEEKTVKALCAALKAAGTDRRQSWKALAVADDLEKVLANWQSVAAPLLTIGRSTGVTHRPSFLVAREVREVSVGIHNGGGDPAVTKRVTAILAKAFAEVSEVKEAADMDAVALGGLR
ncbi:MAG: hypothetical protein LBR80_16955 [Deltaproteobacteria bacterium]|jgi:hypothetical protein|nr:hypothetical protein [Deltaproteobacteria bacterium]